jgi:isopenicillin N synthase-like dioxygenase
MTETRIPNPYADPALVDAATLPVIDIAPLRGTDPDARAATAEAIGRASREVGFFYVVGHGIPPEVAAGALDAARWYFARPLEEQLAERASADRPRGYFPVRRRHAQGKVGGSMACFRAMVDLPADDPDVTAGTPLHGPNRWPPHAPFRDAVVAYQRHVLGVARDLLHAFALALGLPEDRFDGWYRKPMASLQLTHYRGRTDELELGLAEHRDLGGCTLLLQDETPGLEVQAADGTWIAAPPIAGSLVVNIGDWMSIWSGGRFVSTLHRAVNRAAHDRYSIPLFMIPDYDVTIEPLPELGPPVTELPAPFHCGTYLRRFYAQGLGEPPPT